MRKNTRKPITMSNNSSRRRIRIALTLLAIAVLFSSAALMIIDLLLSPVDKTAAFIPVKIAIGEGASAAKIAVALKGHGLIRSETAFNVYIRTKDLTSSMKSGTYEFNKGMSLSQIVDTLIDDGIRQSETLPEE